MWHVMINNSFLWFVLWCSCLSWCGKIVTSQQTTTTTTTTRSPTPSPTTNKHYALFSQYYNSSYIDMEYMLAIKEYERMIQTYQTLQAQNYEIYGFFHTSAKHGFWREVISEQLYLLDGKRRFPTRSALDQGYYDYAAYEWDHSQKRPYASLLNFTNGLIINVGILNSLKEYDDMITLVDSLNLTYRHKITISYNYTYNRDVFSNGFYPIIDENKNEVWRRNETYLHEIRAKKNGSSGEFPTMMLMHGFCRDFMLKQDRIEYASWYEGTPPDQLDDAKFFYQSSKIPEKFIPDYDYGGQNLFERLIPNFKEMNNQNKQDTTKNGKAKRNKQSQQQQSTTKSKKAIVYYFHNKGSCCRKRPENMGDPDPVVTWREVMNAFLLEFPSICLRAVGLRKYFTCGPIFQDGYYSGNFFYSDCAHIAQLPVLPDPLDWGQPEFFATQHMHPAYHVMSKIAQGCGYSNMHCYRDLYGNECPRKDYVQRIWDSVMSKKLPPTMGIDYVDTPQVVTPEYLRMCKKLREPRQYYSLVETMPNREEVSERLKIYPHNKNPRRMYLEMEEIINHYYGLYNK